MEHIINAQKEAQEALETTQFVTLSTPRQCGKTHLIQLVLIKSFLKGNTTNVCILPRKVQARHLYKEFKDFHIGTVNDTELTIESETSSIKFVSQLDEEEMKTLAGVTTKGVVCFDDAQYIGNDTFDKILPILNVNKTPCLICGTPKYKSGFFYDIYKQGLDNVDGYTTIKVKQALPIKKFADTLPEEQVKSEFQGEFID